MTLFGCWHVSETYYNYKDDNKSTVTCNLNIKKMKLPAVDSVKLNVSFITKVGSFFFSCFNLARERQYA